MSIAVGCGVPCVKKLMTYLDVDVLIRDFGIGLASELFPGRKCTCFARSS